MNKICQTQPNVAFIIRDGIFGSMDLMNDDNAFNYTYVI